MASSYSQEWRSVCDKFQNAQTLSDIESRKDPENDPFRSKYKARDLLKEIHTVLKNFDIREAEDDDNDAECQTEEPVDGGKEEANRRRCPGDSNAGIRAAKLGVIEYYLGVNHVETEELPAGEEHLMNCMKLLDRCSITQENVSLCIQARVRFHVSSQLYLTLTSYEAVCIVNSARDICLLLVCFDRISLEFCGRAGMKPRRLKDF